MVFNAQSIEMRIRDYTAHNWATIRAQPFSELSGAVGDLGTFLPILIALALTHTISLPSTLIFSGLWNVLTGAFFGIPLPVQPMKAIAAVAIAKHFRPAVIASAGIFVGVCILLFSVTGLLKWFSRVVPLPVVKGIQVGAGVSLVISAAEMLQGNHEGWLSPSWADNWIWALIAFLGLLITNVYRRVPYGLILFILGVVFAIVLLVFDSKSGLPSFGLWEPGWVLPTGDDWVEGIFEAGLGQIPLTTLNSIIAVVHLASELLPDVTTPSITAVGLSVAGMNLVGSWFQCMPVCHGSGGLAAQFRFGARSGASVIVLGLFKIVVGLFLGNSLLDLLRAFPKAFLAVMVIAAGLELASVGESLNTSGAWDLGKNGLSHGVTGLSVSQGRGMFELTVIDEAERKRRWTVMLVTAGTLIAFKNDGIGFVAGMLCHWSYGLPILVNRVRERWTEGRIRLPTFRRAE
ncbi:hypothetical protein VTO42DRAFT_2041 [Malbranchea cinnamomea]